MDLGFNLGLKFRIQLDVANEVFILSFSPLGFMDAWDVGCSDTLPLLFECFNIVFSLQIKLRQGMKI